MKSAKNAPVLALLCLEFQFLRFLTDVCFQLSTRKHPGETNNFLAASPCSWSPCLHSGFNEPPALHVEPSLRSLSFFLEHLSSIRFTSNLLPNLCPLSVLSWIHLPACWPSVLSLLSVPLLTMIDDFLVPLSSPSWGHTQPNLCSVALICSTGVSVCLFILWFAFQPHKLPISWVRDCSHMALAPRLPLYCPLFRDDWATQSLLTHSDFTFGISTGSPVITPSALHSYKVRGSFKPPLFLGGWRARAAHRMHECIFLIITSSLRRENQMKRCLVSGMGQVTQSPTPSPGWPPTQHHSASGPLWSLLLRVFVKVVLGRHYMPQALGKWVWSSASFPPWMWGERGCEFHLYKGGVGFLVVSLGCRLTIPEPRLSQPPSASPASDDRHVLAWRRQEF